MITLPNANQSPLAGVPSSVPGGAPQDDATTDNGGPLTGTPFSGDWRGKLASAADKLNIPTPSGTGEDAGPAGHLNKFAAGANEAAKANPNPSAPGAWARNILAGTMSSLGDAAHATDNLKPGQGGLSGIENTLAARGERQAKEKQQQFDNNLKMTKEAREAQNDAVANAMTAAQTRNLAEVHGKLLIENDQAAENLRKSLDSDAQLQIDAYKKSHHDVEEGIGLDDLHNRMTTFAKNPPLGPDGKPQAFYDVYSVIPKGSTTVQGPDGKDQLSQTVAVVKKTSNPVSITPELHGFLESYLPKGSVPPVGTDMPGSAFDSQMTQASQVAAATAQIDQFAGEKIKIEKDRNLQNALITANHFMAQDVNDPFVGLENGIKQADAHVQQGQQQLALAQKAGDPDKVQQAQTYLQQSQKEKSDLETVVNSPTLAQAREKHWEIQTKAQEKKDEKEGQHSELTAARVAGALEAPSQLSKRASTYNQQIDDADKYSMAHYGVPYNPSRFEADYAYSKATKTQDTMKLINSVAEPNGSLDIARNAARNLPNMDQQTLNKIWAGTKEEFGNKDITKFNTSMYGLADEYAKIMGGGTATVEGFKQAMNILQKGYNQGQLDGAVETIHQDIEARKRGLIGKNVYMLRQYGGTEEQIATAIKGGNPWEGQQQSSGIPTTGQAQQKFTGQPPNTTLIKGPKGLVYVPTAKLKDYLAAGGEVVK